MLLLETEYGNTLQYLFTGYGNVFQEMCCLYSSLVSLYKENKFLKKVIFTVKYEHILYLFKKKKIFCSFFTKNSKPQLSFLPQAPNIP